MVAGRALRSLPSGDMRKMLPLPLPAANAIDSPSGDHWGWLPGTRRVRSSPFGATVKISLTSAA